MTRTLTLTLAIIGIALPGIALAKDHKRGGHHRGHMMERIEAFDANGDGNVTLEEAVGTRAARFEQFDANKDGALSLDEYSALWAEAMRERMVDQFQRHDDDGNASVTLAEFNDRIERMITRMDRNEDGVVNREDMREGRGWFGRRGGGGEETRRD